MPPVCPKCGATLEPAPSVCRSCGYTLDLPADGEVDVDTSIAPPPQPSRARGCALVGGAILLLTVAAAACLDVARP